MICQHQILPIFLVKSNWSSHHQCFSYHSDIPDKVFPGQPKLKGNNLVCMPGQFKAIVTLDSNHKFLQPILITGYQCLLLSPWFTRQGISRAAMTDDLPAGQFKIVLAPHSIHYFFMSQLNYCYQCLPLSFWSTNKVFPGPCRLNKSNLICLPGEFQTSVTLDSNNNFLQPILTTGYQCFTYLVHQTRYFQACHDWTRSARFACHGNSRPQQHLI